MCMYVCVCASWQGVLVRSIKLKVAGVLTECMYVYVYVYVCLYAGLLGEVVVRHGFTPVAWDPPVLSLAVADLGSFHREMCLRMAQELSITFGK